MVTLHVQDGRCKFGGRPFTQRKIKTSGAASRDPQPFMQAGDIREAINYKLKALE